jgi:hypothetical protein
VTNVGDVGGAGSAAYCDAIAQYLLKLNITYDVSNFNAHTRATLFSNLKHLLAQKRIELLDDTELLRQLRNLRQEQSLRGQIDVRPIPGENDDLAVAVALAANELCKSTVLRQTPFAKSPTLIRWAWFRALATIRRYVKISQLAWTRKSVLDLKSMS